MKIALILGVTGKIGMAIARRLIKEGYNVIGSSHRNELPAGSFPEDRLTLHHLDMEKIESIDSFLDEIKDIEEIEFFTNTVSNTLILEKFEKIERSVFENEFRINLFNYAYFLQKIIPKMKSDSNVIFILSEMVINPQKNFSPYISSKYALLGLMKCLTEEFAPEKIRFNAISPSKMDTNFQWKINLNGKMVYVPNAIKEKQLKTQKFLSPDKVAEKIISIIKNKSINGQNFIIKDEDRN